LGQDNLLLYATGGLAAASFDLKNTEAPTASMWGDANVLGGTNVGWSSGVGIEYRLNSPWSAQIEYLHSDFGNETVYLDVSDITPKLLSNSIKVGVNYRF
jgi:opacity protein-like surface antigen